MRKEIFIVTYEGETESWLVSPLFDANNEFTREFAISPPHGETIKSFQKFKADIHHYLINHPKYKKFLENES